MADVATQFSTISSDAPAYFIASQMYQLAEKRLVLGRFAKRHQLPQRNGKTLRVVRYKRLNLPTATLTEGVPPDAVALAVENVDVTVEQWGIVVLLTDVAQITTKHPALQVAIDRTSLVMSELLEREMANTLMSGTQVFYPGSATSRATISASDKINTALVLKALSTLRSKGAPTFEAGLYGGAIPPQMEADLIDADTTFKDVQAFQNIRPFEMGEIGVWMGVRWVRGTFLPIFKGVAAPGTQSAEVAGFSETGAGGAYGNAAIRVVAKEVATGYERKISQDKLTASGSDSATITTPTSTNYVYDIYSDGDNGGGNGTWRLVHADVPANTAKTVDAAAYAAGTVKTPPAAPADTREVFVAFIIGRDAFGRVELDGMSLQSYITPPGPSWSNPLAQGRKVGAKIMWKSFVIDNDFFCRIEAASGFPATLPA